MASIEIIVRDNQGNIINEEKKRIYDLNLGNKKFGSSTFNRGDNMKNMMDSCKILIRSKTISHRMRQWIQRKNFVLTQTAQQEAK